MNENLQTILGSIIIMVGFCAAIAYPRLQYSLLRQMRGVWLVLSLVPLAVMLASTKARKFEIMRMLNPAKYEETARIARLQPYDPDKTVVLVIHGLMDSQATWTPLINTLRGDPEIRKHYQFWFYSYPSGYPYPHSAALLRKELDAIQQRYPIKRKMVVQAKILVVDVIVLENVACLVSFQILFKLFTWFCIGFNFDDIISNLHDLGVFL